MWMTEEEAEQVLGLTREQLQLVLDTGALVFLSLSGSIRIRRKDVEAYAAGQRPRPELRPLTLAEATERAFGVPLLGSQSRFQEPGWELDGETEIGCDVCEAPLWAFGKAWTSAVGVNYRFWAIACSECEVVSDFDVFDDQTQGWLRDWRKAIGKEPDRRAATPPTRPPLLPRPRTAPPANAPSALDRASEGRKETSPPPVTPPSARSPETSQMGAPALTAAAVPATPRALPATATFGTLAPSRPPLPESPARPANGVVNLYVDFTTLERSKYDDVTHTMSEVYDELSRQHPDLDAAAGRSWSRLRYLRTIDARARELEALASERDRLVANASRKRQALNDVIDALDIGRTRAVILHDTSAAADQTMDVLRARWVEAALLKTGMRLGAGDQAREEFAKGTLSAIVAAGDVQELAVPNADVTVVAASVRTSAERRRLVAKTEPGGLCVSIMVRGTVDEQVGAADHALFPDRTIAHQRWRDHGDALSALRDPDPYTPEPSRRAVDRLSDEPPQIAAEVLEERDVLICRTCRSENPGTRLRCSACYGRLSRRSELAPQR